LRERAEQRLAERGQDLSRLSDADVRALAEELQVHELELEMQQEELRAAEYEAERARDRYHDLFESAPVGYITLDVEGRILDSNAAAAKLVGQPRVELAGQPFSHFVADASQEDWFRHRYALRREGRRQVHALHLKTGDGAKRIVHVETVPIPDGDDSGNGEFSRTALVDITARHAAERTLEAERDHLEERVASRTRELEAAFNAREQLLDSLGNGLFALDGEGRFMSLNPAALEILGYDAQSELIGRQAHGLVHSPGDEMAASECPVCQPRAELALEGRREQFMTADGSSIAVDLHARPVRRADSRERVVVAFTRARGDSEALSRLSRREREVTGHLVRGLTNRQIAEELGISRRTVEEYRAQVMRKLAVGSFAELVRLAGELDDAG
jgi:PAS domain S-box-containing protein